MEAAAKLNHSNIVQAYDASEHEGVHYLVMEYVEGKDLAVLIAENGPLPIAQAVDYVIQAARGLQYAHKHQIVHRDIKPSNLLLDKEGTVKILDMGLARMTGLVEEPNRDRLTGSGQMMGTCDYMAPEQSFDAHQADARADIYSLGCTLYKLLTGHVLYKGESLLQILLAHRESPIPPLCQDRPEAPPQLDVVYRKMVAKRPEDRYQSMTEVITALETCAATVQDQLVVQASRLPVQPGQPHRADADGPDFLQADSPGGTATAAKRKVQTLTEATLSQQAAAAETSKNFGHSAGLLAGVRKKKSRALGIGLGVAGIIVLAAIISVRTSKGTLEIETDDRNVQVAVKQNGEVVEVVDAKSGWKISLKSGQYELAPQGSTDQFQLDKDAVFVKRGDTVKVKVTLKRSSEISNSESEISDFTSPLPAIDSLVGTDGKWKLPPGAPPPAVAPFDAKKAKAHQEAWAKYLGVPVEMSNSIGMKLVLIPPGEFDMGSPKELIEEELKRAGIEDWYKNRLSSEGPQHRVWITKPFYLGMMHVTQQEYEPVTGKNPSDFSPTGKAKDNMEGRDAKRFPVENVSWDDAVEFCRKLSNMPEEKAAGRTYRLPSEAQWEYACRAGNVGRFSFSLRGGKISKEFEEKELLDYGWFNENSLGMTHPVAQKRPNAWGLYDMYGNVWDWCRDWLDYFAKSPTRDPTGPLVGSYRVYRGGCWRSPAGYCRSAARDFREPRERSYFVGFRVSLVLSDEPAEPAAVPAKPLVPAKPVPLDLKPDAKAWDLKPGSPLNPASLVLKPAAIKGLRSWTLETCASRGAGGAGEHSTDNKLFRTGGYQGVSGAGELSPDNKLYATGGHDGVIRFLDPATGRLRIALVNPELDLKAFTWSLHRLIAAQDDRIAIYDEPSGELLASQVIWWGPGKHLFLSPEGHVRCSEKMRDDVVYVALTDDGRQITLRADEFAAKFGWKNDPEKIRLSAAATVDKPNGGKAGKPK